MYTVFEITVI